MTWGEYQMIIVSKNKDRIVNMSQVMSIFIASDGMTIKAAFQNGTVSQIGTYPSAEDVIEMIGEAVGKTEIYFLPNDESVRAWQNTRQTRNRHISGKKTKGHGGS